jgi:hypothetical protein
MPEIKIQFTDKEITPWGGMILLKNMLERINFKQVIKGCPALPERGSNRSYKVETILEAFIVSVWCGANRFLHTELIRQDNPLSRIFNWVRTPGNDTYKRFFRKFNQARNQAVFGYFFKWFFDQLVFDNYTLDFDSTIMTRYGEQQGARKGYNPKKPGRKSQHPLMAFVADCNMVANLWLRSGDAHTAHNFEGFLEDTLERMGNKKVGLMRLDSGFYDKNVFEYLENKPFQYIVAARFYEPIQRTIAQQKTWLSLDEGVDIAETYYRSPSWDKPRRMVMIRQEIFHRPKATGKQLRLFQDEWYYRKYRYSAYITNLALPPSEVWRLYRQRATAENRIKELKYDFGAESFNMNDFWATEAVLNFVMLAYNLMSLFRQYVSNSGVQHRLSTLRFNTFAIGAYFTKQGNDIILKLSLALKRREWFTGIWNTSREFSMPFVFSNA